MKYSSQINTRKEFRGDRMASIKENIKEIIMEYPQT